MTACTFCDRPAEQGIWLRRWPRDAHDRARVTRDVRVRLCARHWRWSVVEGRDLRRDGWIYG